MNFPPGIRTELRALRHRLPRDTARRNGAAIVRHRGAIPSNSRDFAPIPRATSANSVGICLAGA
jgi:hypothetical protein